MKVTNVMLLLVGLFVLGCGNSEQETTDESATDNKVVADDVNYDEMAEQFCKCMRPLFDLQEKVTALSAEGKEEEIQAMSEEYQKIYGESEACILALEEKYGVIEGEEREAKATVALEKACPDIMEIMGAMEEESMEE